MDGHARDGDGRDGAGRTDAAGLAADVASFLRRNFPQIAMHGGDAAIRDVDAETGEVRIRLSGACGGCGVSPMTTRAIRSRLPTEIAEVSAVEVETASER